MLRGSDAPLAPSVVGTRFKGLADVARVATTTAGEDLLRRVSLAAMAALDGASVSLSIWEPEHTRLRCVLNDGDLGPGEVLEPEGEYYAVSEYAPVIPLLEQQRAFTAGCEDAGSYGELVRRLGKGSAVVAPIPLDGRVWGELFVTRSVDQPQFGVDDVDFAVVVAAQVGAAIATSEHLGRAEALAHTDALTGLANRLAIDEWFQPAMQAHRSQGTSVGLIVCDINGLKDVNDHHGHEAGDRVLQDMASILFEVAHQLLPEAVVARVGGDEFAVVVAGRAPDELVAFAEEVSSRVWRELPYGAAVGVASTGDAIGSVDHDKRLFRLADAAQYRAKRTGSRRPVVAGRPLPVETSTSLAAEASVPSRERRLRRGVQHPEPLQLLDAALRALDDSVEQPVRVRLGLVADLVSHHVDAVGWWLSKMPAGEDEVVTLEYAIYRALPGLAQEELATEVGCRFAIAEYPSTEQALRGGAFTVRADEPGADTAELAILDDLAAVAVVGAGGKDESGDRWLVEVYTDTLSGPERDLVTLLRVLVAAALSRP
ncbi:MAG: GGDEF domain-containing protein [Actinomycetia bacterium]|nr:GGDEF domain-containing protein [Actinomycetes bacterium]